MSEDTETPRPADAAGRLDGLVGRLREACNGHPSAKIKWPHRLLHDAADAIEQLKNYVEMDANCPCCQQTYICEDECSFVDDSPDDYKRMMFAREVLTPNAKTKSCAAARKRRPNERRVIRHCEGVWRH